MINNFIPYQEALPLRELGFAEKCFGAYGSLNNFELHLYKEARFVDYTTSSNKSCLAPLYQQAFKWFRDNYDIAHEIHRSITNKEPKYWCNLIINQNPNLIKYDDDLGTAKTFNTYEEAELACIRKLIEIVKEKK